MVAVLSCGDHAVLSHRSAAALWDLRSDDRATSDVTSSGRAGRQREAIVAHQGQGLLPRDITVLDGIPCTSLARTLLDLAETIDCRALERAVDRTETLRLLDMSAVEDLLARAQGRRGAKPLRCVLAEHHAGSTVTESELEELFLVTVIRTRSRCRWSTTGLGSTTAAPTRPTSCGPSSG
jgi:hypothetical protein